MDHVYLAVIPNIALSNSLIKRQLISPDKSNQVFSFITITTQDFKDRIAHVFNSEFEGGFLRNAVDIVCTLNDLDISELKEEIMKEDSGATRGLKKLIELENEEID